MVARALCIALLLSATVSGVAPPAAPVAALGIELRGLGGPRWGLAKKLFFNADVMHDIRDNLHATYVRTGWLPDWLKLEKRRWLREDHDMDAICSSGLRLMLIVPGPKEDRDGRDDLVDNIDEFLNRYTAREPGCIAWAEIANEADLASNGFKDVRDYAAYCERVVPIVARYDVPVITSGTSGKDKPWTTALASLLANASPNVAVAGFGFHPYGVRAAAMAQATVEMRQAAELGSGWRPGDILPAVWITEIGKSNADELYATIVDLAYATPAVTIYEYRSDGGEDPQYALIDNPPLYKAVAAAGAYLAARRR
jgi:hypothetical protein